MDQTGCVGTERTISLTIDGDELERTTWTEMSGYISLYETIWRMFSAPLRCESSIHFRDGIDHDLEVLAMCNYTAYVNVARAFKKIETMDYDFKFSEEIWANLLRAIEVGEKAAGAFEHLYESCTGTKRKIDRGQIKSAEAEVKMYRNRLHDPVLATIKDDTNTRLIPKRELLSKYEVWTAVMYHAQRDDFVTVESQLRIDLGMSCQALQSVWAQMRDRGAKLVLMPSFQTKLTSGKRNLLHERSPVNPSGVSGTIVGSFCAPVARKHPSGARLSTMKRRKAY